MKQRTVWLVWVVLSMLPAAGLAGVSVDSSVVFVTSAEFVGDDLGGVAGADLKCQEAADAASVPGLFKAWISDSTSSPASSFFRSTEPYVLVDGTQVADDWDDLTDGTLDHAIDLTELFDETSSDVWTGTQADGEGVVGAQCDDWTFVPGHKGRRGRSWVTNGKWSSAGVSQCTGERRLYCFEQPAPDCPPVIPQVFVGDGVDPGAPALSYVDNMDGTITDLVTGCMWEQKMAGGSDADNSTCLTEPHGVDSKCDWNQASGAWIDAVNAEAYAGHTDWRLPHVKELESIVDYSVARPDPTIDSIFGPTATSWYWSSTINANFATDAWVVEFEDGANSYDTLTDFFHVRAVRGCR